MLGKGPLWKNIGKEGSLRSPESSLSSAGRPVKAFHIMFQEEGESSSRNKGSQYLKNSSSIRDELDGSPMMITTQQVERRNNEQVLEVISFDSHENERVLSMAHVLKSMTEISEKETERESKEKLPLAQDSFAPKVRLAIQKIARVAGSVHELRQEVETYKCYLLNALSEWEVQAINNFTIVKERIQASTCLTNHEANKLLALQQEVAMLGRSLALQRQGRQVQRRQNAQLQEKLRRMQRAQSQQKFKMGSEQSQVQQLRSKSKRMQLQLSEAKMEIEAQTAKTGKLREVIKERQAYISCLNQDSSTLQKKIKQLKISLEEASSRQRRQESQVKSLRQRLEKDREAREDESGKAKGEASKLKGLLKVSEEQLSQCEQYINKLNSQIKEQQAELSKLHEKMRASESQYCKKLRQCDEYLLELQSSLKEMDAAHTTSQQSIDSRQRELTLLNEQLKNKAIQLRSKQAEIDDMRREYQHKLMSLSRREEGMKAEYRMAVDSQHALKQKWYQRYYAMLSPQKNRNEQPIQLISRPSFTRKDLPQRDARPPLRQALFKVKSERHLNPNPRNEVPSLSSARSEFERSESQRDLAGLGSRIVSLRRELRRQLGQIGLKP